MLAARATLEWVTCFPEQPEIFGFVSALALGLRAPVEKTLATKARVEYGSLLAVLEEDAQALANTFAQATAEKLGTAPRPTPLDQAMWQEESGQPA